MSKILMVDDDQEFLSVCKTLLETQGFTILTSNTLSEAEQVLSKETPDLIILDIMIEQPDDGITFAQKLKKQGNTIPVIMLSALSNVTGYEYKTCSDVLPCTDFIKKPIKPNELIAKIKSTLKK